MVYELEGKLVIAVASSALFDLRESDRVYREQGEEAYRRYQREHEDDTLERGVAFPFIRRILALNDPRGQDEPVEVVLLSRNDPDTGLRVFKSIEKYGLPITRAAFLSGGDPYMYINAFNASLFLSADEANVKEAVMRGYPAGRVLASAYTDDLDDKELRVAFDFDGVVIDDEAERIYQAEGLDGFQNSEVKKALTPHNPGPLKRLLDEIARLQKRELDRVEKDATYKPLIRTAIITSRNAPAHQRVVTTLREWGIRVDETFFLGGMNKNRILEVFKPHLFFDDQMKHAGPASGMVPAVHVPVQAKARVRR